MSSSDAAQTADKRNLVVKRTFDAPLVQVWKAWSDADEVMRWWGPDGFTAPSAQMDFREGGVSLVCMRAPQEFGGQDLYNTWTYGEIVPMERIEFFTHLSDKDGNTVTPASLGFPGDFPQGIRSVVVFKALGNRQTEVTVTEYDYAADSSMYELSKTGMEQCLEKMAKTFV